MTTTPRLAINSDTMGDPTTFLGFDELRTSLEAMPRSPADRGGVALIVRRVEGGRRETPDRIRFEPDAGVPGDAWGRKEDPNPDSQITVMEAGVASLIANGQPLYLFGDNLFLDLDLSSENLPTGSRVRVGAALLEVTPKPHNGCKKFSGRFGVDAVRFVADPETRHRNMRGIYMRVVEAGAAGPGDAVEVISR